MCLALAALTAGCASSDLPPSVWPPADFEFQAEQIALTGDGAQVQRRLRVLADGLVLYGTASDSLRQRGTAEDATIVALPVFERMAAYRLEPNALRAFARRLDRLGIATMPTRQGETADIECTVVVLRWRAFGAQNRVLVQGRIGGPVAELLGVVQAHLPEGERFDLPGEAARVVSAVLHGVPTPANGLPGALALHERVCRDRDAVDDELLLDTFALACASGERARAQDWLRRWDTVRRANPPAGATAEPPSLDPGFLQRFLPPQ